MYTTWSGANLLIATVAKYQNAWRLRGAGNTSLMSIQIMRRYKLEGGCNSIQFDFVSDSHVAVGLAAPSERSHFSRLGSTAATRDFPIFYRR